MNRPLPPHRFQATIAALLITLSIGGCAESSKPTAQQSPSSGGRNNTPVFDLRTLGSGPQPRIPWIDGHTLHAPDGPVDIGDGVGSVALTGETIVIRNNTDTQVSIRDRQGEELTTHEASGVKIATNARRTIVAWVGPDGVPTAIQDGEDALIELASGESGIVNDAMAVVGDDCFGEDPEVTADASGSCSIYYSSEAGAFKSSNLGQVGPADPTGSIATLEDADERGLIGTLAPNARGRYCGKYVGFESAESAPTTWSTCDYLLASFSPDGKHVLATPETGAAGLVILDRESGKPTLDLTDSAMPSGVQTWRMEWEDNSHVAVVAFQKDIWAIVRVSLDGTLETAARQRGDENANPYDLTVQP